MSYYTDPHRKKRSKRPFILFFLLLLSALLFFRDRIACEIINYYVGVKFIQNKDCPLDVTSITKDHGHLYLKEVCFENHEVSIFAEQVSVYTSIHFFPFSVTSYVDFKRPKVVLKNSNSENSKISLLYFIFPGKYLNLKWNVDSGSINVKNSKDDDLFFSYKTDQSQNFIGRFILEEKKEDQIISLCNLLLKSEDHILSADLHVNAGNLAIVQQYLPYLRLKDNLTADYLQGGLKLESSLVFNAKEKNIEQFSSQFFLSDFCLVSEKGSIACTIPESSGSFSYNKNEDKESLININKNISFWKNCNAHLKAQDFVFQ
ncbi:MAG: hypothetical protein FJZ57_00290, partial [Chlamydiae bacterium]|nr:hypothetical protein [Chlamydiota bacterium]